MGNVELVLDSPATAGRVLLLGGFLTLCVSIPLVYWNQVVIPRKAVDDMCEMKFQGTYGQVEAQKQMGYFEQLTAGQKEIEERRLFLISECKVANYARLNKGTLK